jgi:hypothetical protein
MPAIAYQALFFILCFYGILLVAAPVALRIQFRWRAKVFPRAVPFESLPASVRAFMAPRVEEFSLWGFDLVAYLKLGEMAANTQAFIALLSNPHTNEWADVSYVTSPGRARGYIEFVTRCAEDAQVDTNTNPTAPVLFPLPGHHVARFPQIRDVLTLYRIHRKLVQERSHGFGPMLPPPGQEIVELQRRLERYAAWQQSRGYMYLDASGENYRLTWKGAILGGWRSIWPVPLLRNGSMRIRKAAILRQFGAAD